MYFRGRYGGIVYAKGWCGFKNPREQTGPYDTWHREVKAYMQARSFDPGRLTAAQLTSMVVFASSLNPVQSRIMLIKTKHHSDDVKEVYRQLRMLVRDTAKELQTAMERERAKRGGNGKVAEPASK